MMLIVSPVFALEYTVTGLGYDINQNYHNRGTAINESGQAVGYRGDVSSPPTYQGFFWDGAISTLIGLMPGGTFSQAFDVNDLGQVVGTGDSLNGTEAFFWEAGVITPLGDDGGAEFFSSAKAINNLGIVAGQCSSWSDTYKGACFYKDGAWNWAGYPLLPGPSAFEDLSESVDWMGNPDLVGWHRRESTGQYVGYYWSSGGITDLSGAPTGPSETLAYAMNASIQIVGSGRSAQGWEACMWDSPDEFSLRWLGKLPGDLTSDALDINDQGEVVGVSQGTAGRRAFKWVESLGMVDLNTMLDTASAGWILEEARGINNQGQIVGRGINPVGENESFVLTLVGVEDADGDGFLNTVDCNDGDASIFPGALEVKHDGIDQDCNGYDLTIEIIKADYNERKTTLTVEATSSNGAAADLSVVFYGPMTWNDKKSKWVKVATALVDPVVVTVNGPEGSESAYTGEPPCDPVPEVCNDGTDNDCDGLVDSEDPDCPSACNGDGICDPGEDCLSCPDECAGKLKGKPSGQFCCGNGLLETAEGDGAVCDGNF